MLTFDKLPEEIKNKLLNQNIEILQLPIAQLSETESHSLENASYELKEQIANHLSFDEYAYIIALPNAKQHPLYEVLCNPQFQQQKREEYCNQYVEKYLDQQKAFLYFIHSEFPGDFMTGLKLLLDTYFEVYTAENLFREKARDAENFVKLKRNVANLLFYTLVNGSADEYKFIYTQIRDNNFLYPIDHTRRLGDRFIAHLGFTQKCKDSLKIEPHTYSLLVYWMAIISKNFDKIKIILGNSRLCREIKPDQDISDCMKTYDDRLFIPRKLFSESPYYKGILEHFSIKTTFQTALLGAIKGEAHSDDIKTLINKVKVNEIYPRLLSTSSFSDHEPVLRHLSLYLTKINPNTLISPDTDALYINLINASITFLQTQEVGELDQETLNRILPYLDSILLYAIACRSVERTQQILDIFSKYNVTPAQRTPLSSHDYLPNRRRETMKGAGILRKQFFILHEDLPIETKAVQAKIIQLLLKQDINISFYQLIDKKGLIEKIIQDPFYSQNSSLIADTLAVTQKDHEFKETKQIFLQEELIALLHTLLIDKKIDDSHLTIISQLVKSYGTNCGLSDEKQQYAIQALSALDNNSISEETIKQALQFKNINPDQPSFNPAREKGFYSKKQKLEENEEVCSETIIISPATNPEVNEQQDESVKQYSKKNRG